MVWLCVPASAGGPCDGSQNVDDGGVARTRRGSELMEPCGVQLVPTGTDGLRLSTVLVVLMLETAGQTPRVRLGAGAAGRVGPDRALAADGLSGMEIAERVGLLGADGGSVAVPVR
jgi:hypothetical protein